MNPPSPAITDSAEQASVGSLRDALADLCSAMADVVNKTLRLAALECQQAALSLSAMLCLAVVVAVLMVSSWLLLMAAAMVWWTVLGLSWELALLSTAVLNIGLSFVLIIPLRLLSYRLRFEFTRRQLSRTQ